ncbi:MAG: serine/threonine protein kinase [Pirellulales bacterium]|nr:serine/threonine protein kinase [Pirellulales bacterium]
MWQRVKSWFQRSRASEHAAHMTFSASRSRASISRTVWFLRRQLWAWPILAVIGLSLVGYFVNRSIRRTMEYNLSGQLQTLLSVERSMLERWLHDQELFALMLAQDPQVRHAVVELLDAHDRAADADSNGAEAQRKVAELRALLLKELEPGMSAHDFAAVAVADKRQQIVAANKVELIGRVVPEYEPFLLRALAGHTTVSTPFASVVALEDVNGRKRTGVPTMFVCAPVRDDNFQIVGVLGLRIRPEAEFTRILQLGRIGASGETYAVDKDGLMVSNSRFDDQLILAGLIPDEEDSASIVRLLVRDPGGNIPGGYRPRVRRRDMPMTRPVAAVVSGTTGVEIQGHRDYRGVRSVAAWTWLPDYELGLITEIDYDEAFGPLVILQRVFYGLHALLIAGAIAIFVFTLVVARLRRNAQKAAIEAKQLGQYRLEQQLGKGAMGVVYKGHHAMLRRPTAIKLLQVDRVTEQSVSRFEREVQLTCQLNNPHTVAIYDFGRTPEGVFYYAMEYLDGIDLQKLVDVYGPQPEGRVVEIIKQMCASLNEAHSLGLVHRDIKPANVMLNERGGEPDVVKLLDFGLVRALDSAKQASQTSGGIVGTPLYMSPESIQTPDLVDGRSDLYAVGAVGYFLLTGHPVFDAPSLVDLCQQHVTAMPMPPSQRLGKPIDPGLEHALMLCLEKSRSKRPQTARDLAMLLEALDGGQWTRQASEDWWRRHRNNETLVAPPVSTKPAAAPQTSTNLLDQTMLHDPG